MEQGEVCLPCYIVKLKEAAGKPRKRQRAW